MSVKVLGQNQPQGILRRLRLRQLIPWKARNSHNKHPPALTRDCDQKDLDLIDWLASPERVGSCIRPIDDKFFELDFATKRQRLQDRSSTKRRACTFRTNNTILSQPKHTFPVALGRTYDELTAHINYGSASDRSLARFSNWPV